jgi:hypothetical protein
MEPNPHAILTAIKTTKKREVSSFVVENLQRIANHLTNECEILPDVNLPELASECQVSLGTLKNYIKIFRDAYLFVSEHESRDQLANKAQAGIRTGIGILCLLDFRITGRERFDFYRDRTLELQEGVELAAIRLAEIPEPPPALEPIIVEPKPKTRWKTFKEIEETQCELRDEITRLRQTIKGLTEDKALLAAQLKESNRNVERLQHIEQILDVGVPELLTGDSLASQLAKFFTDLGQYSPQTLRCLSIADKLRSLVERKLEIDLPSFTIWQQNNWARILLTDEARQKYFGLTASQKGQLKNALRFLSLDSHHPSLRTKKPYAPDGITKKAFYSRASDKIRFYWTAGKAPETDVVDLVIHRINVKRG